MPSPSTALQIVTDALSLTNAVGIDQTLTAQETTDALRKLNDLIEIFSTSNLAVWTQQYQFLTLVPGQALYTVGTGGTWNIVRPVRINPTAFTTINGVGFPCYAITEAEYSLIPVKLQAGGWADRFIYINDFPLGLLKLWPVPDAANSMSFNVDVILTQAATAATVLSFPPGYVHAFVTNLAVMLGPIFGKKMSQYPEVVKDANNSLGSLKRANIKPIRSRYDVGLLPEGTYINWQRGW